MASHPKKWSIIILSALGFIPVLMSQNLVPNPSFEFYTECPTDINGGFLECTPWQNGNSATSDYYNKCCGGCDVWVPANWVGNQEAHTGNGYAGSIYKWTFSPWQEYLQVQLTEPCEAGFSYNIDFFVSLADFYCGIEHIGVYFSPSPPDNSSSDALPVDPQFETNFGYMSDTENWVQISGCFPAKGGEQWITIGNFHNDGNTIVDPMCSTSPESYYLIDDVSVTKGVPYEILDLELGDEIFTCGPYEIDPDVVDDVQYNWSDGSNEPTLTVTETGTYTLSISVGCTAFGVDSVRVTFIGSPDGVDLGPQEVTICESGNYSISLDPDLGDYEWQDGSTDADYDINTAGVYSVTLDDGCDLTTDEITVYVEEAPAPFSLGNDQSFCSGEEIEISFDADLGNFTWQDGSTSSDYTIVDGGTYSLTISNMCGSYSDEIEITEIEIPDIDFDVDELIICEGQIIDIEFDDSLGDFEWQDGSTSSFYAVSVAGTYSVTVSNECGSGSDQMDVVVLNPPEPFTLGDDAFLCPGEEVVYSFDENLGDFHWQDNSTFPDYTIEGGGIYALTISNQCGEQTDDIEFIEIMPPLVELGDTQMALCEGEVIDIDLDPDMGDFVWDDGSSSTTYLIFQPGIYSVTVTNECGVSSDIVEVIEQSDPVFDFGPDIVVCPAQLPIILDAVEAMNTDSYLWQDNSTGSQLLVPGPGIYTITVSNSCASLVDDVEVFVQDTSPSVILPADQSLCVGDTFSLDAGGLVGNYLWQDGSESSAFLVDHEGIYSLSVTNACGSGSDTIIITYTDTLDQLDLGPDVSLCPGEQFIFDPGISGVNYLWQDMSTSDSLTVTLPGAYSLQISNACDLAADTVFVSVSGMPPVVELPALMELCSGDSIFIDAGIAGVDYLWNDGSQLSSIFVSAPGLYSVTVSNTCGADVDTVSVLDAGEDPVVALGADMALCPGEEIIITPVSSNVDSWLWHDGSTSSSFNVTTPGVIILQGSNDCGTDADTLNVTQLSEVPSLYLGPDTSLCEGEIIVLEITEPDVDILWFDGTSDGQYEVTNAGIVYATISNPCGSTTDSVSIALLPAIPSLDLGNDQSLCPGETITILPAVSGVDFLWHDGSTLPIFSTMQPGQIILSISNECGTAIDTLEVIEDTNGPQLDLGEDVKACEGEMVTILSGISGVDYLWQDGSTTADYTTAVSGTFILSVSNECGADIDSVEVDISGKLPSPALGPDTTVCDGSIVQLTSEADDDTQILWPDGSSLPIFNVTSPGLYVLIEENDCGLVSDSIMITYTSAPAVFDLGPDSILCPGEFILLNAPVADGQFTWQDGSHGHSMIAMFSQTYSLEISNACGSAYDELAINYDENIPHIEIGPMIPVCPGEVITLDATQLFDATYEWNSGSVFPVIQVTTPGLYAVRVTAPCESIIHEIELAPGDDCRSDVYIPNVFSPNGDELNDDFEVSFNPSLEVTSLHCTIYDRWGNNVYVSNDIDFSWDGRFRDKTLLPGVYVYHISYEHVLQGETRKQSIQGDLTLLR